jgi:2-dehydropantoate 2-reductase
MSIDNILIVGSGALATFFAARLAASGLAVSMLGTWPAGLRALQSKGACISQDADTPIQCFPIRVVDSPAACPGARWALVLVKAWQTQRAAQQLSTCLAPDGITLTLQNGLGNQEILRNALGANRVAIGITTLGARLIKPGLVRPANKGKIILEANPQLNPLVKILRRANFELEIQANMSTMIWHKLAINAAINPITALLEVPNGALLSNPSASALMLAAGREVVDVARVLGFFLDHQEIEKRIKDVALLTKGNHSSMLQDIARGAQTEIDAICGVVCRAGQEIGVPTPINHTLWQLIEAKASQPDPTIV